MIAMKTLMRVALVLLGSSLIIFLYRYVGTQNMGVLNPKGVIALAEKNLFLTAVSLMLIVVIPVFIMLFSFAWRYRAGNIKAKYTPDWHGNKTLEIVWWSIPTVLIIILATITWKSTHDLDPYKPIVTGVKPVTIEVVALDWKWLFIYPEEHIATVNYIRVPKDTPIHFKITADAPMNAFWVPQLGGQVYAMAGMTAQLYLMGTEEGVYKGVSSNFSGDGFSGMKFNVEVSTEDSYKEWLTDVRLSSKMLSFMEYIELAKKSSNNPVVLYSEVESDLYQKIISKYMPSMDTHEQTGGVDMHMHDMLPHENANDMMDTMSKPMSH